MFNYLLKKSNRSSLAIKVADGEIYVLVPMSFRYDERGKKEIERVLLLKEKWIKKRVEEQTTVTDEQKRLIEYKEIAYLGKHYPVESADVKSVTLSGGRLLYPKRLQNDNVRLCKALVKWFKSEADIFLKAALDRKSKETGLKFSRFCLTSARGKWGSYSSDGTLRINWRIMFLPPSAIEYLILHELCHSKELNHSKSFWARLERLMPSCKEMRRFLRGKAFYIGLYR